MKNLMRIGIVVLAAMTAVGCCGNRYDEPFFTTRGIVLSWDDVKAPDRLDWVAMADSAHVNTLSIYCSEATKQTPEYRDFIDRCAEKGIAIEFQEHAMAELLPRAIYDEHPEYFRMDEQGNRVNDYNCCPSSQEALEIIARNAKARAEKYPPTNHKYYFWLDDGGNKCFCNKCRDLNDSDQALLIENRIIEALREVDDKAMLAHLSYQNTLVPPAKVKPAEGVFLEFAPFFRTWERPLDEREAQRAGMQITHGEYLDALEANLKVFPAETAQVLEYWMDISLVSDWKKPARQLTWHGDVFRSDIATYARLGIRNITAYAIYLDADYVDAFHDVSFVYDYGKVLWEYRPEK